jgi:hypothetical protein
MTSKIDSKLMEASDAYLAALVVQVESWPNGSAVDLDEASDILRGSFGDGPEVDLVVAEGRKAVDGALARVRNVGSRVAGQGLRRQLGTVRLVLDALIVGGDSKPLHEAEAALTDAETALRDCRDEMESAISRGDVDAVLALRVQAEVQLPAELASAQAAVLRHQIAQAEILIAIPEHRAEEAARRKGEIQEEFQQMQEKMSELSAAFDAAGTDEITSKSAASKAKENLASLWKQLDAATEAASIDQASRLRRLAGLPPEHTDVQPEPARRNVVRPRVPDGEYLPRVEALA